MNEPWRPGRLPFCLQRRGPSPDRPAAEWRSRRRYRDRDRLHGQAKRTALPGTGRTLPRNPAPDIAAIDPFIAPRSVGDRFIDVLCRLLFLAILGHAGPICITPLVGQAAALLKGRRACRVDWIADSGGSRVSDGDRSHPE